MGTTDQQLLEQIAQLNRNIERLGDKQSESTKHFAAAARAASKQTGILQGMARHTALSNVKSTAIEMGIVCIAALGLVAVLNPKFITSRFVPAVGDVSRHVAGANYDTGVKVGDSFNGSQVAGVEGTQVAVATIAGQEIYFPGKKGTVEVVDADSILVTITEGGNTLQFRIQGIKNAVPGEASARKVVAVADEGKVIFEQFDKGKAAKPLKGWLSAFLGGNTVESIDEAQASGMQASIMGMIKGQESAGSYSAKNKDSHALGAYQIMPEYISPWAEEAGIAGGVSEDEFLANPQLQDQIAGFKVNQYLSEALQKGFAGYEACRYVAASWYSGDGDNLNDAQPQYWDNGAYYPSIRDYTEQACSG
jgi:hypothetical protein